MTSNFHRLFFDYFGRDTLSNREILISGTPIMFQSKNSSINISVRLQYWDNVEGAVITLFNEEILPCYKYSGQL